MFFQNQINFLYQPEIMSLLYVFTPSYWDFIMALLNWQPFFPGISESMFPVQHLN